MVYNFEIHIRVCKPKRETIVVSFMSDTGDLSNKILNEIIRMLLLRSWSDKHLFCHIQILVLSCTL